MAKPTSTTTPARSAAVAALALLFALILGEVLLRVLPIPGIGLQPFYYDETTGGKLYPGSTLSYRALDGELVVRRINSWGFLDTEHDLAKAAGTIRIGFFGDSYTEARQVGIDDTFFRHAQDDLHGSAPSVETMAFGIAGRSTTQAWLESLNWMIPADIDWVVYVFCENDPGDQLRGIARTNAVPFASLENDSLIIDVSFRRANRRKTSALHRSAQYIKAHSLLVSTIVARWRLLARHGVNVAPGGEGETAGHIMGPSSWPSDSLATYAWDVTARVIERWNDDVAGAGRQFAVLRVPRAVELGKPIEEQDAFAPRLYALCDTLGIALIDPTTRLLAGRRQGKQMYDDHFTPDGHAAVADEFAQWWLTQYPSEDPDR